MPQLSQQSSDPQSPVRIAATGEPRFLDQIAHACRLKHLAYRTEQSYVSWVKRYILFHHKRHPREMGPAEVRAFLTHLAVNRNVSASTQNQALNALVFMYRDVVRREPGEIGNFERAKRPRRLPAVLSRGSGSSQQRNQKPPVSRDASRGFRKIAGAGFEPTTSRL